jgi:hypothetical protein
MEQQDLSIALPGVAGGRATRDRYGLAHLRELASRGGRATRDRYGLAHLRELASRGGRAKRYKLYSHPATIRAWDGVIYRRVPYWPHQARQKRRRRPIFVRIEQGEV